jgi:hypothetical protein
MVDINPQEFEISIISYQTHLQVEADQLLEER